MASSEKIRVLIVDDIAETRENVRKLLQFEHDVEVVGAARTGQEGIDLTRELSPDVVLMDINMPDIDGLTATEKIRQFNSSVQIIILSVQSDPNYMRKAIQAGASDYLAKPPTVEDLTTAVRRAGKKAHEEKKKTTQPFGAQPVVPGMIPMMGLVRPRGKIITVYSPKGGTGCTVLAMNLAIALHNEDTPVVLVDGNLQFGDVAISINEKGKYSVIDLAQRVSELDTETVESMLVKHQHSGVKILAAPSRPEIPEPVTGEQFSKVLSFLQGMFSYVIVDTASALTQSTLAALDTSDLVILVATQDFAAIKNAHLFLELADSSDIHRKRILFVINRYDKRIQIDPEKVAERIKQELTEVIPLDERTVIPSLLNGIPFMVKDKNTSVARAVLSLAEAIRKRIAELEQEETPVMTPTRTRR